MKLLDEVENNIMNGWGIIPTEHSIPILAEKRKMVRVELTHLIEQIEKGVVPEEDTELTLNGEYRAGFNYCRSQVISNFKKLNS